MTADYLADSLKIKLSKLKFKAVYGSGEINGKKVLIVKPQTFMNLSGESVREIMDFFKLGVDKLIVICDDITLDVGRIRIRRNGSDGGQRGMRSIIEHMGRNDFVRIKVGVGKKPNPEYDLADWVLSKFKAEEIKPMEEAVINAAEAAKMITMGNIDKAMNKYNS